MHFHFSVDGCLNYEILMLCCEGLATQAFTEAFFDKPQDFLGGDYLA